MYLVVSKAGQYTKHIYIGSQRIVSKLGDLDSYGADPRRIEYAGTGVDGAKVDYKGKYTTQQQIIKDRYAKFEVPYYGKDNDDYVNGQGFCCDDSNTLKSFSADHNDNPELFQYYYHSDHLGSSSLITNLDGETVQHIEYVPFGEVFIEERNNTWNTPYLFNAKELDEETGLYYYGARYYDPRISLWLSTDPLQEKYPNISTYIYCVQNPVKFIDPDGEDWLDSDGNTISAEKLKNVKVYIFHDNDFRKQALKQYEDAVKIYGEGAVALSNTGSVDGFREDWKNMDGNIEKVMIMTHGKNQSIKVGEGAGNQFTSTGDEKTNLSGTKVPNIQDLPNMKGDISNSCLLLYTCHSDDRTPKRHGSGDHEQGDLAGTKQTVAESFANTFNFKYVQGTEGSVNYYNLFHVTHPASWSRKKIKYLRPYPEDGKWRIIDNPRLQPWRK